ncbi:MAG: serine protease [Caulobacterales bacterium]
MALFAASTAAAASLKARVARLACAVVRIETSRGVGTGFFVRRDGLLVTAGHLVYDISFRKAQGEIEPVVTPVSDVRMFLSDGRVVTAKLPPLTDGDRQNAGVDLAAVQTNLETPCFIPLPRKAKASVGDHLLAIAYPTASPSAVLYDGFMSSLSVDAPTAIGIVPETQEVVSVTRSLIRVQMPLTRGSSGAPAIKDDNTTLGVVTEIPVLWTAALSDLVKTYANNDRPSGGAVAGFDTTKLLAQLAFIVSEFETPGSGTVVPISYLRLPPRREAEPRSHEPRGHRSGPSRPPRRGSAAPARGVPRQGR